MTHETAKSVDVWMLGKFFRRAVNCAKLRKIINNEMDQALNNLIFCMTNAKKRVSAEEVLAYLRRIR